MLLFFSERGHRRVALPIAFVFACALGLFGQSTSLPLSTARSALSTTSDINATLTELKRVAPATAQDLSLYHPGGKFGRLAFWRRDNARLGRTAEAARRNLELAVPNLIHDAQESHGSISATFKLYKDLSLVGESLNTLVTPGDHVTKAESTALTQDLSDLNRIREALSSHFQQAAASLESVSMMSSAGRPPKKIIIDDSTPEKPAAKKHSPR